MVGTIDYLAPEMLLVTGHDTTLDIWCLGVMLYEMLVGKTPFLDESDEVTKKNILDIKFSKPDNLNEHAGDLIEKLLVLEPASRLPLKNVLRHNWIKETADRTIF